MLKILYFLFISVLSLPTAAKIEDQIKWIDQANMGGPKKQILKINDYAENLLIENGLYKQAVNYLESLGNSIDGDSKKAIQEAISKQTYGTDESVRPFLIYLGGAGSNHLILSKKSPGNADVQDLSSTFSVLLNPTLIANKQKYLEKFGNYLAPHMGAALKASILLEKGRLIFENPTFDLSIFANMDKGDILYDLRDDDTIPLIPIVMMGENALFIHEAFVYALSRGAWLVGLSPEGENETAVYDSASTYYHDIGHYFDALHTYDEEKLKPHIEALKKLAENLYKFIIQSKDEKTRKSRALMSFYLLHENYFLVYCKEYYFDHETYLEVFNVLEDESLLCNKKNPSMKEYFTFVADGLKFSLDFDFAPSISIQKSVNKDKSDQIEIMFMSEHPNSLVQVYPELMEDVFGAKQNMDKTLHYSAKKTLKKFKDKIEDFRDTFEQYFLEIGNEKRE